MNGLSFEGFRTALIDSEARVRVVSTVPPAIPRLLGLQLFGGFVDGGCYRFSPNLNCFIGGRGTGKSTVIQALGYAVGAHHSFEQDDNCADSTVVLCEDANGVRYRYERQRAGSWTVAAEDQQGKHIDFKGTFRVEFYKQGHLSEVAKDPMKNAELLQEFLDRHLELSDARADEEALVEELEHNSAQLKPLESGALQIGVKEKQARDIDQKLKAAEEGRLKDVAAAQAQLGAEKAFVETLGALAKEYALGVNLDVLKRDYKALRQTAGEFTTDTTTTAAFVSAEGVVNELNAWLVEEEKRIDVRLSSAASALTNALSPVAGRHQRWEERISTKIDELRKKGLSGNIAQLSALVAQRKQLTIDLTKLNAQKPQLERARAERTELLKRLTTIRETLTDRRKAQVAEINAAFKKTIDDYSVYLFYRLGGIKADFVGLVSEVMSGSFMQDKDIEKLCMSVSSLELARRVQDGDVTAIGKLGDIGPKWADELVRRFRALEHLHRLEVSPQPPAPVIKVLTKTKPQKDIPIGQLSDGQKHTILLTIALLAESNDPLIIDQPEDDLDNAFIFSSVVRTLRYIKERRQVFIVTHNANIAVLGDSEIIFPMRRDGGVGKTYERGAIDRAETRRAVQDVLEGGRAAFLRRKAIYGI
jgi:energy-coupling factor transporter ATP-binding protein EcfA2